MVSVLMRKSLADVTRRKGRSILMIVGILIGVLGLTAVNVASDTFGRDFFSIIAPNDAPNIIFNVQALPSSVATRLQRTGNVQLFQVRQQFFSQWHLTGNSGTASLAINSYSDWTHIQLDTFQLTSGRLPGPGEIVMATSDRFIQPITTGGTVTVEALDGHPVSLRIVGLAHTDEQSSTQAIAYMSADGLQQITQTIQKVNVPSAQSQQGPPPLSTEIMIKTQNGDFNSVQQTVNRLSAILHTAHITPLYTHWFATTNQQGTQLGITGVLDVILILTVIALLLVCFMIFNTVTIMLTEQIKIIGTMKALGGTRWRIMRGYLLSVGIYAVVGTALGLALGLILCVQVSTLVANQARIDLGPFQVSPWVILASIAVGLLAPLLAALPPLWIGTRITVHEAIAAYGVTAGGGKHAGSLSRHLHWVPQTAWLGLRGIFRKPGRVALTLLALTISGAVFMAVQIMNESIGTTTYHNLYLYSYDAEVNLPANAAVSQQLRTAIQSLPNIAHIEQPFGRTFVMTSKGEMEIDSLPATTSLYHPQLVAGRWLTGSDYGDIVLSDIVAQRLNITVGGNVTFHLETASAGQTTWRVVGIVHEVERASANAIPNVELGLTFTTPENMHTLSPSANNTQGLWLVMHDRSPQALQQLSNQLVEIFNHADLQPNFRIPTLQIPGQTSSLLVIYGLFDTVAIIVGLVGLLGLFNTLLAEVLERRLEIGILRSLGATGWRVGTVFCIEGLVLASIAWCIGTLLGMPTGLAMVNVLDYFVQPFDVALSPTAPLLTLLFVLVVACLASFGPALSASRVRIAETLRYE